MWQEAIVYLIGIVVLVYIGTAVYRMISGRQDPCSGCGGCILKEELEKKSHECPNACHGRSIH